MEANRDRFTRALGVQGIPKERGRGFPGLLWCPWMLWVLGCQGGLGDPRAHDWEGPQVVASNMVNNDVVSPTFTPWFSFSEPLDPASVTQDGFITLEYRLGETCEKGAASCSKGTCYLGRCQLSPITKSFLSDLSNPPLSEHHLRGAVPCEVDLDETGREVRIHYKAPLKPHLHHVFLLSPILRDIQGNPLEVMAKTLEGNPIPEEGELRETRSAASLQPDQPGEMPGVKVFITGGPSMGRPQVMLFSPPEGSTEIPTFLKRVVTRFSEPVSGINGNSLKLVDLDTHAPVKGTVTVNSPLCRSQPARMCAVISLQEPLIVGHQYGIWPTTDIRDDTQEPLFPQGSVGFKTGASLQRTSSEQIRVEVALKDGCAAVDFTAEEPIDAWITREQDGILASAVGKQRIHLELGVLPAAGGPLVAHGETWAGITVQKDIPVAAVKNGFPLVISEVLANPAGPEPDQEFVEIFNRTSEPVDLAGWTLDDGDDGKGVFVFPAATLPPRSFAVIVGKGFNERNSKDPAIAKGTLIVRGTKVLGSGGLSNNGESLVLKNPARQVVSTFDGVWDTSAKSFDGVSVEKIDLDGCGHPSNWRREISGKSSPGGKAAGPVPWANAVSEP